MSYEIVDIIEAGTYGTVCVAVDDRRPDGDQLVALKILKEDLARDEQFIARLRDEGRMLTLLEHPHIVDVFELIEVDGRPVMVMEFLRGVSLIDLLDVSPKGLPGPVALEIIRQAASALDAAWSHPGPNGPLRVIHRDIKPANLILTVDGVAKLLDFGLARADFREREAQTRTRVLGTVGFVSPERLKGTGDGPEGDVYALGVVLYELLTGAVLDQGVDTGKHQLGMRRALDGLRAAGLHQGQVIEVAGLLGEMCSYRAAERPSAGEVERTIGALGLRPALKDYARSHVIPLLEARVPRAVQLHPHFEDVAPLDTSGSSTEERLRKLLADPRWPERRTSMGEVMADDWPAAPFLEVLERARVPWWKVWVRPPSAEELLTALEILSHRREVRLTPHLRSLARHSDPRVASVAQAALSDKGTGRHVGSRKT